MSETRHDAVRGDDVTVWAVDGVFTGSVVAAAQQQFGMHRHDYHELFWGTSGPFSVTTERRMWIVSPMIGLFVPAGVLHGGHSSRSVRYHLTEFPATRFEWAGGEPQAVAVPAAARELLLLDRGTPAFRCDDVEARAARLAFDLVAPVAGSSVALPRPADGRARLVAEMLLADPGDQRTLAGWGRHVGASARTLSRLFAEQTGLSFARWRNHARIGSAMVLLANGSPVGVAGRAVGYETTSSFTRAFREAVGEPPGAFVAGSRRSDGADLP